MKYQFVGHEETAFPTLAHQLVNVHGRDDAVLTPGQQITVDEVVVHPELRPMDAATRSATQREVRRIERMEADANEQAVEPVALPNVPPRARRRTKKKGAKRVAPGEPSHDEASASATVTPPQEV